MPLIRELAASAVRVNVTAILRWSRWSGSRRCFDPAVPAVVSIFAGRVADTGIDPVPMIGRSLALLQPLPQAELLWGSVREVLNIFQAAESGAHIVTVTHDVLAKAQKLAGMDLDELSVETVRMFFHDAAAAGYAL